MTKDVDIENIKKTVDELEYDILEYYQQYIDGLVESNPHYYGCLTPEGRSCETCEEMWKEINILLEDRDLALRQLNKIKKVLKL